MIEVVAELTSRGQDMRNFCRDLLAVFRDLMVFKVSGGEASLVESSVLNTDEINVHASHFSESDLLRFFNSMSETESKLKEAVQPRYVLETGLVKLTEMRRVVPVERLLERLSKMEEALGGANAEARSETGAAAAAEKKTLNSTPAVPEPDAAEIPDPPKEEKLDEAEPPPPLSLKEPPPPAIDPTFLDSLPVKLPPIDSEALEHVDDTWLDAAYEKKLARSGDDLLPIANVQTMVEALVGRSTIEVIPGTSNGSAASAAAPARSHIYAPPVLEESDDIPEPSRLPDNATEEESLAYALNHPVARRVMRVFRAKIVGVTRS
jgi:DNA polymerase III gamma/tau subunit